MSKCLTNLTTSGSPSLDDKDLKVFKKFCRKSDDYVRFAFHLIMEQLEKNHAEIRLSAFQVAAEIFTRSHAFREILITNLQEFLTLTTGTETNVPLPPPKSAADKLKEETLKAMQRWYDNYGKSYRKLDVGYNYLKNCKHIDFQNIQARNEAERMRAEQQEKKKQKQIEDRLAKVLKDITENKTEIEACVKEAENCLSLLLPSPEDFLLFSTEDMEQHSISDDTADHKLQTVHSVTKNSEAGEETGVENRYRLDTNVLKENSSVDVTVDPSPTTKQEMDGPECNKGKKDAYVQREGKDSLDDSIGESRELDIEDENFYSEEEEEENGSDDNENDRTHGIWKPGYNLNIEVAAKDIDLKETEDNTDVLQSLRDVAKLIGNSFLPQVTKWLEVLGNNGAKQEDIQSMIDLKCHLEVVRSKCLDLKLLSSENLKDNQESDEEDLEDVPEKEGYEATVPSFLDKSGESSISSVGEASKATSAKRHMTSAGDMSVSPLKKSTSCGYEWSMKRERAESVEDPTSMAATLARIQRSGDLSPSSSAQPSTSISNPNGIPFIKFGKDLEYWEDPEKIEVPSIVKLDSLHRFWASGEKETEKASKEDISLVLNRSFSYTGQFEPVKWSCRVPLPNGNLCPRMDRVKCPFHGPIIARDSEGKPAVAKEEPTSSVTAMEDTTFTPDAELPPWRDPKLQREIEEATGHDLGSARSQKLLDKAANKGKGKGKGKRRKTSGLTDIKAALNTTRKRLEKRIFNKRSMKRVCSNLDGADFRRVRDKFGNQFNYSLS